ncbi:hypothetical protein [Amphibacillus jilinensis]|uniref:hypothetical protein n=1 Tax=Amphibacillus jilinensis TaxID=1216008 RepID=UPI0002D2EDBF|nr:hypothetical protein [Amphibacillus jilinensis]
MANLSLIIRCSILNIKKWIVNPRIYLVLIITFTFLLYNAHELARFTAYVGEGISPWVFAHLFTPPVLQVFAFLAILLFCDAPFNDHHMPFVIMRIGRLKWFVGQLIYIVLSSILFTIITFLISVAVFIPHLKFTMDWGIIIRSLANDPMLASDRVTIFFNPELVELMTPIKATVLSLLFFCLVTIFIGLTILCFNVLIKQTSGVVVAGSFVAFSLFSYYLGFLSFGHIIFFMSPINWLSISSVGWNNQSLPSPTYTIVFLVLAIVIMGIIAAKAFVHKDLSLRERSF